MANDDRQTSSVNLGEVVGEYQLRQAGLVRWGNLGTALICLTSAIVILIEALYLAYYYYAKFGPAIVWKNVRIPTIIVILLLVVAVITAWNAYTKWQRRLILFENGLAYYDRRGEHLWQWDEIQCLRYRIAQVYSLLLSPRVDQHYVFYMKDGQTIEIDSRFVNADQLAGSIRRKIFPRLFAKINGEFLAGKPILFGKLTLSRSAGLQLGKTTLPWEFISAYALDHGSVVLTTNRENKTGRVSIGSFDIPNLDVFLAILAEMKPLPPHNK